MAQATGIPVCNVHIIIVQDLAYVLWMGLMTFTQNPNLSNVYTIESWVGAHGHLNINYDFGPHGCLPGYKN